MPEKKKEGGKDRKNLLNIILLILIIIIVIFLLLMKLNLTGKVIYIPASEEVVIDNSDTFFKTTGNWISTSYYRDSYRTNYFQCEKNGTATWKPHGTLVEQFNVYLWWPNAKKVSEKAAYSVFYANTQRNFTINQLVKGGKWNYIGSFGNITEVKLYCSNETVVADAVKFERDYRKIQGAQL